LLVTRRLLDRLENPAHRRQKPRRGVQPPRCEREAAGLVGRALAELFVEETYPGAKVLDVETKTEDKRLVEVAAEVEAGSLRFGPCHGL